MKKMNWLLMLCLALLPALQSCSDDSDGYSMGDISYPNWATVRVAGNAFYLDSDFWGTLWPVNTNMGRYEPVDGQRVVTVFNPVYDNYEGYDHAVKIVDLWHALTKGVETLTAENEEEYGNDPIRIYQGDLTISGGYMNIIFVQNLPNDPNTKHRISLVKRETTEDVADDGYVRLELRYNNYGDVSGTGAYGLVSYNLSGLDTEGAQGIKLKLNSEKNGEVELTFDPEDDNTTETTASDFSKMQLK